MSTEQKLARARANLQVMQDLLADAPNDPIILRRIQLYQDEIRQLEQPVDQKASEPTNPVLPGAWIHLKLWGDQYFSKPSEELSIEGERMFAILSNPANAVALQLIKPEVHDEPTGWHIQINLEYPRDSNGNFVNRDGWNIGRYGELFLKKGFTPSLYYWLVGFTSQAFEDRRDDFHSTVWEFYDKQGRVVPVPEYDVQYRIKNMKNKEYMTVNGTKLSTSRTGSYFIIRSATPQAPIQPDHGLVSNIIQTQVNNCTSITDPIERAKCLTGEATKEVGKEVGKKIVDGVGSVIPWWVYLAGGGVAYLLLTK